MRLFFIHNTIVKYYYTCTNSTVTAQRGTFQFLRDGPSIKTALKLTDTSFKSSLNALAK